jgi:hypothetical protein
MCDILFRAISIIIFVECARIATKKPSFFEVVHFPQDGNVDDIFLSPSLKG